MKIRHIGLLVKDLDLTAEWYKKHFGFEFVSREHEDWMGTKFEVYKMKDDNGVVLELIKGGWLPHFALEVDDVDAITCQEIEEGKIQSMFGKKKKDYKIYFVNDPDGHVVELVEVL